MYEIREKRNPKLHDATGVFSSVESQNLVFVTM